MREEPSKHKGGGGRIAPRIPDKFETIEGVQRALREAGLEACQLIVGVDFTKSNDWAGEKSFGGKCLHATDGPPNPYHTALSLVARTLETFDDDQLIPCYGFGDLTTQYRSVFSFFPNNAPANGLPAMMERYLQIAPKVDLSGPTSFAPLIHQAMRDVYYSGMRFHLLLILADGQVSTECLRATADAIVAASSFPLAIVMVGVGDGPWDMMKHFDDALPKRQWDNFQFVDFNKIFANPTFHSEERREASFALNALMELPDQYKIAQYLIGERGAQNVARFVSQISPNVLQNPPPATVSGDVILDSQALV